MKNTKRFFTLFTFYDKSGIERYLERKAVEGWLLEKMGAFGWRFRAIAPQKLHFSVNYFPKASPFDAEPGEQQLMFQDFCAHTGWKLADSAAQMQVFYNDAEDPVPIETDALMELETIHKASKSAYLSTYYMQFFLAIFQLGLQAYRYAIDPMNVLASNAAIASIFMWLVILFLDASELRGYYRWRRRALAAARLTGTFTETKCNMSHHYLSLVLVFAALGILFLSYSGSRMANILLSSVVLVLGIIGLTLAFSTFLKRRKVSAKVNQAVTIVLAFALSFAILPLMGLGIFRSTLNGDSSHVPAGSYEFHGSTITIYHDPLPLTLEDLDEDITYEGYTYEWHELDRSFIATRCDAIQNPRYDALGVPDLSYTVTEIHIDAFYDLCKAALIEDFTNNYNNAPGSPFWKTKKNIDPAPWGADEAYQLLSDGEGRPRYLLCYDERIVEITFDSDWALTEEHKAIVGARFG